MTFSEKLHICLIALPAMVGVSSCSDDFGNDFDSTSETITFSLQTFQDTDSAKTRSKDHSELVDVLPIQDVATSDTLYLEIYAQDAPLETKEEPAAKTRGTKMSTYWESFGMLGYKYKAADGWDGKQTPNLIYNDRFTVSSSSGVIAPKEYFWPGGRYFVKFFGVFPYGTGKLSAEDYKGNPTLEYQVPTDVSAQQDIEVAKSGEIKGNSKDAVKLNVTHPLTTINFKTDNTQKFSSMGSSCGSFYKGAVHELTIRNIYSRGIYDLETGEWCNQSEKASFTMQINKSDVSGTTSQDITPADQFFFIMPQTAPDDAELIFTYTDSETNTDRTFRSSLKGMVWKPGKTYTYKLATTSIKIDYTFEIDESDNRILPVQGGVVNLKIKSYKTIYREGDETKYVNVPWTNSVYQSYNGGSYTTNTTLNSEIPSNTLSDEERGYSQCTLTIGELSHINKFENIKMNAPSKGAQFMPYNLASESFSRYPGDIKSTANCYIVDFKGWGCFPTVFGTTYKDGVQRRYENEEIANYCEHDFDLFNYNNWHTCSFKYLHLHPSAAIPISDKNLGEAGMWMDQYKSYKGNIKDYTDDHYQYDWSQFTAKLDWEQGTKGNITDVELFHDDQYGYFIRFQSKGQYGNAVISLYDNNGTRVWSWHLWCTDQVNSNTDVNVSANGMHFTMAAEDLGYFPEYEYSYYPEKYRIQLTQRESLKKSDYIYIEQKTDRNFIKGNAPIWQFGRAVPLLPMDKTRTKVTQLSNTVMGRLYYNIIYAWEYFMDGLDKQYYNIWSWENMDVEYTSDPTVKSMYDPCPPGYCLPSGLAFNAFGMQNIIGTQPNDTKSNPCRNPNPQYQNDISFFTDSEKINTISFHGRYGTTNGDDIKNRFYYFTGQGYITINESNTNKSFLYCYDTNKKPYLQSELPRNVGGNVRPVREE